MSPSLKRLAYLGPIIGFGIGVYMAFFYPYFKDKHDDVYGFIPFLGLIILVISLVGLFSAFLLHVDRPIGGLFLTLSGILSCLMIISIPAGLVELTVIALLIKTNVAYRSNISRSKDLSS